MSRCEDFPCCGHELGCCPDFDEAGRQLNMKCTCGASVTLSGSSICQACMDAIEDGYLDSYKEGDFGDEEYEIDPMEDQHIDGMYEE